MRNPFPQIAMTAVLVALSACGGGGGGGSYSPGGGGAAGPTPTPAPPALAPLSIGMSLPSGAIGVENDPTYGAIGGYTQTIYSQTLAFQTGTTVTIQNLGSAQHTLNVLSTTAFPATGPSGTGAAGGTTLTTGYATGVIAPGATVTATLGAVGTYFLGCAFHYANAPGGMRTALIVTAAANPAPGPQATPGPSGSGGTGGSGCHGIYC